MRWRGNLCAPGRFYLGRWSGQEHAGRAGAADRFVGDLDVFDNHSRGQGVAMDQPVNEQVHRA